MYLSYILFIILKFFYNQGKKNIIENYQNIKEEQVLNNLLQYINLLINYYILFFWKDNKTLSSIALFYFIKYGGIKQLFKIAKIVLFISKNDFNKKEVPLIELFITIHFWKILFLIILNFLEFEFSKSNGLYIILIRENEISKNFRFKNELDIYARYIILNDLIEVLFNDEKENINNFYEIEKYSNDFFNLIIEIIKNCFYYFNEQKDILDLRDIYKDGYKVYEVMQCIQEGKNSKDNIINYLKEIHKEEIEKKTKINQNEINNEFSINHTLSKIEKLSLFPSKDFMYNINILKL